MSFIRPSGRNRRRLERRSGSKGFALLELLAVITVCAILAALLLPALNHAKSRMLSTACLHNLKQLQMGWQAYTADHNDNLPANKWRVVSWQDDCPSGFQTSADAWVLGDATLDVETWGIQNGSLYPYVRATSSYHCPADRSTVDSRPKTLRTRSYSMSYYMNGSEQKVERKTKWPLIGTPSQVFIFLDEHENSINDGVFFVHVPGDAGERAEGPHWMDLPADRHTQGCNFSFADGHVDHWKWKWAGRSQVDTDVANSEDLQDLRRLQTGIPHR